MLRRIFDERGGTPMADERKGAVTLRGNPLTLGGPELKPGQSAPDFTVLDNALKPVRLAEAKGKVVILSSVPSLDTPTCDTEPRGVRRGAAQVAAGLRAWPDGGDRRFAAERLGEAAGATRPQRPCRSVAEEDGPHR